MNDELMLAVKASEEFGPAARQFVEAVGDSRVGAEFFQCLVESIRYRWAPHRAKLLMRAAEKIRESGLPAQAVEDRILLAVLEHGGLEGDAEMQERWSSLLANGATGTPVPPAYPEILRQIEPVEARFLDALFDADQVCVLGDIPGSETLEPRHLDNLQRLGLLLHHGEFLPYGLPDRPAPSTHLEITPLGTSLVIACRTPNQFLQ